MNGRVGISLWKMIFKFGYIFHHQVANDIFYPK